jgi:hypothetical protein
MAPKQDPALQALKQAAEGLSYTSETDAPLVAFQWQEHGNLTKTKLRSLTGAKTRTRVTTDTLENFFQAVPPEDKEKFNTLAEKLKEMLRGIKVYRIGNEAKKQAYIVGKTAEGNWAGLKTTVVET